VFDGAGDVARKADLSMVDGVIETIGFVESKPSDVVIDVSGRYLLPGFIDSHSHADAAIFSPEVQRSLLRQGVTTVIGGQDGVSYAPGNGEYASTYFGALLGRHPSYTGGGVSALLEGYDGTTPVNVGYLIPAGTVRHLVRGYAEGTSTPEEVANMCRLITQGLDEGALGLSTGLDYIPNIYADTAELIALCRPVAAVGGIYVTHMRGGYESNASIGVQETAAIALATGVAVHISHYHGPSALLITLVDKVTAQGISITFDAYPYRRGCSLLAMPTLPAKLLAGANNDVAAKLIDPDVRAGLLETWFPLVAKNPDMGQEWPDNLRLAHIAAPEYFWAHGLTLREAAQHEGISPENFTLDILAASALEVSVVMKVRNQRQYEDLEVLFTHSGHIAGSDGIYIGAHPHPRAWGTFAKYLRLLTRERGSYDWSDAARHLSGRAAERFCLSGRGRLAPGYIADIAVIDPTVVKDMAGYASPREDSIGIDDVFVAGEHVLANGCLTGINSGRGLRRSAPVR